MPSKGNPALKVRLPAEQLAAVTAFVDRSHDTRADEPWTISEFIRVAIAGHMRRAEHSRTYRARKRRERAEQAQAEGLTLAALGSGEQAEDFTCNQSCSG